MRQIKFRVWNKEKKYMVYPFAPNKTTSHGYDSISFRSWKYWTITWYGMPSHSEDYTSISVNWKNGILMLFTGLKDKNGKEIYEGDILSLDKIKVGFVEFSNGEFQLLIIDALSLTEEMLQRLGKDYEEMKKWYDMEVIGNIYENPELASGKATA